MYEPFDIPIEEGFLIVDEEQAERNRPIDPENDFEIDPDEGFDDEEIPW